uniref:Uncharacterized protein n=1 Tax=Candidatus Kentrum sp. FM TaxID=2126340 RepID=A0A450TCP4_9GAMM|nr:MAG: hypothetical protein BECKFM1743C_GA0114222_103754 [Candidatus Kentron sp. FM]VFK16195.1 MAG: hypothetical protein BECKFM1743B_GA0114221_104073 [Candidatus Kentron sp. FM]
MENNVDINLWLLLDSGLGGEHKVRPYAPPNVGANLVFAHYA